jgi:hypothetical protein
MLSAMALLMVAADDAAQVTITAQKREESAQEAPVAVRVLDTVNFAYMLGE